MVTLRRPAASGLSAVETTFLPRATARRARCPCRRPGSAAVTRHFFLLSASIFFLSFCTPNVSCGASVQAWLAEGGAMKRDGPDGVALPADARC